MQHTLHECDLHGTFTGGGAVGRGGHRDCGQVQHNPLSLSLCVSVRGESMQVGMSNFGMPRIGNPEFAIAFNSVVAYSQRMVHQDVWCLLLEVGCHVCVSGHCAARADD